MHTSSPEGGSPYERESLRLDRAMLIVGVFTLGISLLALLINALTYRHAMRGGEEGHESPGENELLDADGSTGPTRVVGPEVPPAAYPELALIETEIPPAADHELDEAEHGTEGGGESEDASPWTSSEPEVPRVPAGSKLPVRHARQSLPATKREGRIGALERGEIADPRVRPKMPSLFDEELTNEEVEETDERVVTTTDEGANWPVTGDASVGLAPVVEVPEVEPPEMSIGDRIDVVAGQPQEPRNAEPLGTVRPLTIPEGMRSLLSGKTLAVTVRIDREGIAEIVGVGGDAKSPFLVERAAEELTRQRWLPATDEWGDPQTQERTIVYTFD